MKLALGADHAGYKLKAQLILWLKSRSGGRHRILDVGTLTGDSVDYPDYAGKVARAVAQKRAARGILICGTGIGMSIAANKIRGIRAGVAWNPEVAALTAEHNGTNVLCLPGRFIRFPQARRMVQAFLRTKFAKGRHLRRLKKIAALER